MKKYFIFDLKFWDSESDLPARIEFYEHKGFIFLQVLVLGEPGQIGGNNFKILFYKNDI